MTATRGDIKPLLALSELPDEPPEHRIPGLLSMRGSVLISAYRKTGKSTLIWNLNLALTTSSDFLGLPCKPVEGLVVVASMEMHASEVRNYGTGQGHDLDSKQVRVQDYAGETGRFQLWDDIWRQDYAEMLYDNEASVLVIEPLHPLTAGQSDGNDNDMMRQAVDYLGEIASQAELRHLFIVDHTGHAEKGRARGASSKEDGVDMLWNIKGESSEPRTLTAIGRSGVRGSVTYTQDESGLLVHATGEAKLTPEDRAYSTINDGKPKTNKEIAALLGQDSDYARKLMVKLEGKGRVERIEGHGRIADKWQPTIGQF